MNTLLLRTSPAPAVAELSEVAANDDAMAAVVAVAVSLPPPAATPVSDSHSSASRDLKELTCETS